MKRAGAVLSIMSTAIRITSGSVALLVLTALSASGASGNIQPVSIEIDYGVDGANLYPDQGPDWVKDSAPNTDIGSLTGNIAVGIIPGLTGAVGGTGHWYGVRIVDGIAGNDKDIFLTGGKENDPSTWNIGPGTVGSSKYDITQAYLANNREYLYFGMERRGNNGTTAFDFEFNQEPPYSKYIPKRTVGDVLFTFEMNGSGSSGSAVPYYFVWNGTAYVQQSPAPPSLISSINQVIIPAAPWGYVNSKGNWTLGDVPRFSFAEASVLLAEAFPGFDICGNTAYVQVRTRASVSDTSDLKDTTESFEFQFGGPTAVPSAVADCYARFSYSSCLSKDSAGNTGVTPLGCQWTFVPKTPGVVLEMTECNKADGVVKVLDFGGNAYAEIECTLTVVEGTGCYSAAVPVPVQVLPELVVSIAEKTSNGNTLSVTVKGLAPGDVSALQWQKNVGGQWINIQGANAFTLSYSSFEQDVVPSAFADAPWAGKLWEVPVRLHAERLLPTGELCAADSAPVTLKKIAAVDP